MNEFFKKFVSTLSYQELQELFSIAYDALKAARLELIKQGKYPMPTASELDLYKSSVIWWKPRK